MTRGVLARYVAVLAILGSVLVGIGPAMANSRFTVTVNHTTLVSRHVLTVTATSKIPCTWAIRWAGQVRIRRNSEHLVARFVAPRVARATRYRLSAICVYRSKTLPWTKVPAPVRPTAHRTAMVVEVRVPPHWFKTTIITVVPRSAPIAKPSVAPGLPDTGGPAGSLVILAFGSLLTGAALVRLSRRRVVRIAPRCGA